jgi:hypothetical protein
VGDPPATNHREAVMLVLDRMHVLWAIDNSAYNAVYPGVSALAPGAAVTSRRAVAAAQPNRRADLAKLQDLLHVNWHLTNEAYDREHTAVTSGARLTAGSPTTCSADRARQARCGRDRDFPAMALRPRRRQRMLVSRKICSG